MAVNLKPREQCKWDAAALGEIMLRLDPGDGRIRTTRSFQVWEGGGEYNVVRGLRRCFGLRTTVVTSIVDNEIGRLLEDLMLQGGVESTEASLKAWFGAGVVCVGMGSNLVTKDLLKAGDYAGITAKVKDTLELIRQIRGSK